MCERIRNYLMNKVANNLVKLEKWKHKIMPMPIKRLDKGVLLSRQCLITWSMSFAWQVHHSYNGLQFVARRLVVEVSLKIIMEGGKGVFQNI